MSAFDGLICKCGREVGEEQRVKERLDWMVDGYPILADDGFWEYLYVCECGKQYWRTLIGDDYPEGE